MILIPQRLFESPQVNILLRDGNVCILSKQLSDPIIKKEGYISNHVVIILLEGEQQIRAYEDQLIKVKAGEVLFIPRGMYQITDLIPKEGTFRSLLFYFDNDIIQEFIANTNVTKINQAAAPNHLKFGKVPLIHQFAKAIVEIYKNQRVKNKSILNLKILELLHLLNDLAGEQQFANFLFRLTLPQKRNIKAFMANNFNKPLKIEDYAYLTGRSVSTFRRDFKSFYDTTPQKWLREKRMEKALQLLNAHELSVTQLAYEVGYENISYFIKAFKNYTGLTPKQFMLTQHRDQLPN